MQGNTFKIFAILAFVVVALYYLFPTVQTYLNDRELAAMTEAEREAYQNENFDALQKTSERSLKLGLDLQGGMHVTLEVGLGELFRGLAENRADDVFNRALAAATTEAQTSREPFVDLFLDAIEREQPGTQLSRYFRSSTAGITARSSNEEVRAFLNAEASSALDRAIEIIRQRVDRFGVSEPSIVKQGNSRIVVELPGVDDPQRVRELLRGTAKLQFHLMADPQELTIASQRVREYFASGAGAAATAGDSVMADTTTAAPADTSGTVAEADSASTDSVASLQDQLAGATPATPAPATAGVTGRTYAEIVELVPAAGPTIIWGAVAERDTAEARRFLSQPAVRNMLPGGVTLMYSSDAQPLVEGGEERYLLLGVRSRPELAGDVLTDAGPSFDPFTNEPKVSLTMNSEGARRWSQITGANVGKQVAVVLDNVVYTYPVINERIPNGRTEISGVSRLEMEDIVNILKAGALPAPVQIIEERTVGPSLGRASTRAGFTSLLIGFLAVTLFMMIYYRGAGMVAAVALVLNVLFLFGVLAAFGAVLTLPGIAGIVLTLGMAVDANVLIFERVREEMDAGKSLRAALDGGFDKALSAILDGNITTFLIGVILYSFGVGPIQGFAVTLMAGIVTSLFAALVVTRLVLTWLVQDRQTAVSFG